MSGFKIHRAKWILPIFSPPIEDGAIAISKEKIVEIGKYKEIIKKISGNIIDHGEGVLFPALVNVHTHLEFSALKGLKNKSNFISWLKEVIKRKQILDEKKRKKAEMAAYKELKESGTALFANITNILENSNFTGEIKFFEFLGFNKNVAKQRWVGWEKIIEKTPQAMPAAHAPYSVHPKFLKKIKKLAKKREQIFSIHVAESEEEVRFLLTGKGLLADLLKEKGVWEDGLVPYKRPIIYLESLGVLDAKTLCVHCVEVTQEEVEILSRRQVKVCLCPRSNIYLGLNKAPFAFFKKKGIFLCLGTDSLASNTDLNLFNEIGTLLDEGVFSPSELLEMATWRGSIALGMGNRLGTLLPGTDAKILFAPVFEKNLAEAVIIAGIKKKIKWIENDITAR